MTKQYLKDLLKCYYKDKSEMPGLIVRGKRKPSYIIMYKLYMENNVPFISWYNIEKFLKEEEEKATKESEQPLTEASA